MAIPVIESISEDAAVDVTDETSTLTQPTSLATGEWIFPIVAIEADDVATSPFDDATNKPTGCDLIDDFGLGDNTDVWAAVYSRLVTGEETWPLTVAWAETAAMVDFCGITLRVSKVNDSNPVNIVGTPAAYTSAGVKIASSITTTEDDCLGVALIIFDGADGSPISLDAGSVSAGWSIAAEHVSNTGAVGLTLAVATKEQASAGALGDCTFTPAVSDGAAVIMFAIEGDASIASAPTVSDVTPDPISALGSITITVDSYDTVSGVEYNSVALMDVAGAGPTEINASAPKGGQAFGSLNDIVVTDANGSSTGFEVGFAPPTGYDYVTLTSAYGDLPEASMFYGLSGLSALAVGDQVAFQVTADNLAFDGEMVLDEGVDLAAGTYDFDYYILDASDSYVAGTTGNIEFSVADTTPDAFDFVDVDDADVNTVVESNTIVVTGIDSTTDISVDAGEYRVNAGAWTSEAGEVDLGDEVTLRITSAAVTLTGSTINVDIGGVEDTWTVTTNAEIPNPSVPTSRSPLLRVFARYNEYPILNSVKAT